MLSYYVHTLYLHWNKYTYTRACCPQFPCPNSPRPTGGNSTCSLATLTRVEWGSFHPRHHSLAPGKYGVSIGNFSNLDMIGAGALWWKTLENYWKVKVLWKKGPPKWKGLSCCFAKDVITQFLLQAFGCTRGQYDLHRWWPNLEGFSQNRLYIDSVESRRSQYIYIHVFKLCRYICGYLEHPIESHTPPCEAKHGPCI